MIPMLLKKNIPFVSIIIPVADDGRLTFLSNCLKSLSEQSFKNFEVVLVTSILKNSEIKDIIKKYSGITVLTGPYNKSTARNIGSKRAKGEYLLHIDIDYVLSPKVLEICHKLTNENKVKAVILHELASKSNSIWQKARALEKKIAFDDPALSVPQLIEKKLFKEIGGFDERVDPLDDWGLYMKLKKLNVKIEKTPPLAKVYESANLGEMIKRRFHRGQSLPILQQLYGNIPQTSPGPRIQAYLLNLGQIVKQPHIFSALALLRIIDLLFFYLGTFFSKTPETSIDIYKRTEVARSFDRENRKSPAARYKDYRETTSIFKLLDGRNDKILELGAGTGRITEKLVKKGYNVVPTDTSMAMLSELSKKKGLPKPLLIKTDKLPFKTGDFDYAIGIRVVWHIMDQEKRNKFLKEALRVARSGVIMDFAINKKYSNPLTRFLIKRIMPDFYQNTYYFPIKEILNFVQKNKIKVEKIIPLEILPTFMLDALPAGIARLIYPVFSKVEDGASRIIPAARLLIKFKK